MDSPSARKPGDFNWGSTLWHEMSHVFILTATNFRVPRWFTEGLAVHEEGERSPEWGDRRRRRCWRPFATRNCCRWRNSIADLSVPSIRRR